MRIMSTRPVPKSTKILPSTLQPDYTVKYNGQVISEKEFLQKLIKVIKEQKEMKKKEVSVLLSSFKKSFQTKLM